MGLRLGAAIYAFGLYCSIDNGNPKGILKMAKRPLMKSSRSLVNCAMTFCSATFGSSQAFKAGSEFGHNIGPDRLYRTDELRGHMKRALDNGVTQDEIRGMILISPFMPDGRRQ